MKIKYTSLLLIISFFCIMVNAQPVAFVENERVVYEDFRYQPVLTHTFEIRNKGDADLEILSARPT